MTLHDGGFETRHRAECDLAEPFPQLIGPGGPAGTQHQRQVDAVQTKTGGEELDGLAHHLLGVIAHAPSVMANEPMMSLVQLRSRRPSESVESVDSRTIPSIRGQMNSVAQPNRSWHTARP